MPSSPEKFTLIQFIEDYFTGRVDCEELNKYVWDVIGRYSGQQPGVDETDERPLWYAFLFGVFFIFTCVGAGVLGTLA
jgi:hypothetical protein